MFTKINKISYFISKKHISPFGIISCNECCCWRNTEKKIHQFGTKTITFSNKDLNDMTEIVNALEDSDVLMKGITKALQNDKKRSLHN